MARRSRAIRVVAPVALAWTVVSHGTLLPVAAQAALEWTPFSAKFVRVRDGETFTGVYSRHANGSTRLETWTADRSANEILLYNFLRRRIFLKSFDGRWGSAPLTRMAVPPTRKRFDRPGLTEETVSYEGRQALRLSYADQVIVVLPELNFFVAQQETARNRIRHHDITVAPQPDADFEPPVNAIVRSFESRAELGKALRTRR